MSSYRINVILLRFPLSCSEEITKTVAIHWGLERADLLGLLQAEFLIIIKLLFFPSLHHHKIVANYTQPASQSSQELL